MYKNFICHYFFVSNKSSSFGVLSSSVQELESQKEILKKLFSDHIFSSIKSFSSVHHEKMSKMFNIEDETILFKIENVATEEQLRIILEIKNDVFEPKTDFEIFLSHNNLLNSWIEGKLSGTVSSFYKERSREFGRRERSSECHEKFDDFEKIWKLPKYFEGMLNERYGDYSNFYYKLVYKLTKLSNISCNDEWLKKAQDDDF